MRRVSLYAALAVLLCAFVSPSQSHADGLDDFTLTDGLGNTITWQLPASPKPSKKESLGISFGVFATATINGIVVNNMFLDFANQNIGGGLIAEQVGTVAPGAVLAISSGAVIGQSAPQFYSGPETAPTFLTGSFSFAGLTDIEDSFGFNTEGFTSGTLTITPDVTSAPEPSTLVLLAAGLLGMGAIFLGKLR